MSRSGYSEDCEYLELWRGAVDRAIAGRRGQTLLQELEAALLALPEKRLCAFDVANPKTGEVCALGAVALKRRLDKGAVRLAALREIEEEFPEGVEAETMCGEFNIAEALAKEITYINDEAAPADAQRRYEHVLRWVQSKIRREPAKSS